MSVISSANRPRYRPKDKDCQRSESSALFMQRDVFDTRGCGKSCTCDCQPPPRCGKAGWFDVEFRIALQTCARLSPGLLERWALGGLFLGIACAEMRNVSCCRFRSERASEQVSARGQPPPSWNLLTGILQQRTMIRPLVDIQPVGVLLRWLKACWVDGH